MASAADFIEVRVSVDQARVAAVETLMESQGALAVTLSDVADVPVLEPPVGETPLWPNVVVSGLFPPDVSAQQVRAVISLAPGVESPDRVTVSTLQDRDWRKAFQAGLEPMCFGQRLWIVPSHCEPPEGAGVVLRLDPGLAFGSGTHPSTRLCLEWIDGQDLAGADVVDFGCGSGVLAVAAALQGAARVTGVDNDPQALIATRENADVNGVSERIRVAAPEGYEARPADVVLANILSGTLIELAPLLSAAVRPGGWLVLAGILEHQADAVAGAFADAIPRFERERQGEWVRLSGQRSWGQH